MAAQGLVFLACGDHLRRAREVLATISAGCTGVKLGSNGCSNAVGKRHRGRVRSGLNHSREPKVGWHTSKSPHCINQHGIKTLTASLQAG